MSTVYRDTAGTVSFTHPIGTPLSAAFTDAAGDDLSAYTQTAIAPVGGVYTVNVPWQLTQYDGTYTITWTDGSGFSRKQTFDVVTPIVDLPTLQTLYTDGSNPSNAELAELESVVRLIVETYTRQSFGYSYGNRTYIGNGTGKLILNEHCADLDGILGGYSMLPSDYTQPQQQVDANGNLVYDSNGNPVYVTNPDGSVVMQTNTYGQLNLDRVGLIEDGWRALIQWPTYLTVRESPPMELVQFAPAQDGTIRIPRRYYQENDRGTQYTIHGTWGYYEVPDEVREAALLLANDYITNDSGYRDRYLSILKIQQDSFTYHPGAFRGTGNARADLLLGKFRRNTGMIIL